MSDNVSYDGDPIDFSWNTPPWMGEGETVSGTSDDDLGEVTTTAEPQAADDISGIVRRTEPTGGYPAASVARMQRRLEQYYSVDATRETIQQALVAHTEWIDPTDDPDAKFAVLDDREQTIIEAVIEDGKDVYERIDSDDSNIDEVLASRSTLIRALADKSLTPWAESDPDPDPKTAIGSRLAALDSALADGTGDDSQAQLQDATETDPDPDADATATVDAEYDELTPTRQRIVDELVRDPDRTDAALADAADCSSSYISMVRRNKRDIIDRRRQGVAHADSDSDTEPHSDTEFHSDTAPDSEPGLGTDDGSDDRPAAETPPEQLPPPATDTETAPENTRDLSTQTSLVEREWEWDRDREFETAARAIKATAQHGETERAVDHLLDLYHAPCHESAHDEPTTDHTEIRTGTGTGTEPRDV